MAIQAFTLLLLLLLTQWALPTHSQEVAEIISFEFSTTLSLALGSPPQTLHLLPTFYTSPSTTLLVPTGAMCLSGSHPPEGDWNPITEPREGSFVETSSGDDELVLGSGSQIVRWRASSDVKSLNLTLRRGRGESVRNVSLIETDISNDGEYPWHANSTYTKVNLTPGSDYSLMLWTENPPRQSISGFFTLGPTNATSNSTTTPPAETAEEYAACIKALGKNGYYNETLDADFVAGVTLGEGIGITSASWKTTKPGGEFSLPGLPVSVIHESDSGYGMVGLSALQRARNSRVPEMDVVSLYLGSKGVNGSVVMGGFDEGLIDHGQKAVFSKANVNSEGFAVAVTSVKYIAEGGGGSKETEVYKSTKGGTQMALSYNSFQIRLPPEMLTPLLPLLGNPSYDKGVDGYVYTGTPPTDYTLRITLWNGTSTVMVSIPATSLTTTDESTDNPLTSHRESGQTYLRIAPTSPTDGPSLGRPFLEHIYLINAPPTINKFHISAVPSPPRKSNLTPASRTSIAIFLTDSTTTNSSSRSSPALGPMIGGILGGVLFLVLAVILYIALQRRRTRSRSSGSRLTVRFAPSSFSPPTFSEEGEKSRTRSLATSTNLSAFEKEVGVFAMPPNHPHQQPRRSSSAPLHRPRTSIPGQIRQTVSQQSTRRKRESENSTVARVLSSSPSPTIEIYEVSEGVTAASTATMGKFYTGAGIVGTPPNVSTPSSASSASARVVAPAKAHVRTASLGRMVTPVHVEFSPGPSRRSSVRTPPLKRHSQLGQDGRSSGETDESSVFGLGAVAKDGEFLRKEEAKGGYLRVGEGEGEGDADKEIRTQR